MTWEPPNLDELFEEDNLLLHGFKAQGIEAQPVIWNDPGIHWDQFDIALIRSTWDYLDEREHFMQVLSQIEASSCRLFNPLATVRWNIDKRYLFDLEKWGVPMIPTYPAWQVNIDELQKMFVEKHWQSVILKPTIGLGGSHSYRVSLHELDHTLRTLRASHPGREYLIQPFVERIVTEGEWSFVYFKRQLSHVLLKKPAHGDYRAQGIYGGTIQSVEPRADDRLQAEAVIAKLPFDILYARLDFVRMEDRLAVIEIELIEPILSFNLVPDSIARLVKAVKVKLETKP